MMGYIYNNPIIKREQELLELIEDSPALNKQDVPLDQPFVEVEDNPDSFLDSLLNFDGWVDDHPSSLVLEVMDCEEKPKLEIKKEDEVCVSERLGDLGSLIQEGMGMVSLTLNAEVITGLGSSEVKVGDADGMRNDGVKIGDENVMKTEEVNIVVEDDMKNDEVKTADENDMRNDEPKIGGENGLKNEEVKMGDESMKNDEVKIGEVKGADENAIENEVEKSDEESEDTDEESSSSSSSSSDEEEDDVDEEVKGGVEMEEGEIIEDMVSWSEDEDDVGVKGPIRSKNEVQDLPPVPPVTVTIEPHHQTLPVGVVLSIIGAQVIVEGVENHNPLSEGSILWITETRTPLGVIDEIFGPVKNPYYIVRYNSESEVPTRIQQGSLISFVPEFADYVLNNNNLYKKGYDASGDNDEELSEELEFSDDEKEAEYKRMKKKMSKRGSNEQKTGHMKKDKKFRNRGGNLRNEYGSSDRSTNGPGMNMVASSDRPIGGPGMNIAGSSDGPSGGPGMNMVGSSGGPGMNMVFSQDQPGTNFTGPPPSWQNGFNMGISPFMPQNFMQQPYQNLAFLNLAPFSPQFNNAGQMFPPNFVQNVQPNFGANPTFAPWQACMPQNNFNQQQVAPPMTFPGFSGPFGNVPQQGGPMPSGPQMDNSGGSRPPFVAGNGSGNAEISQNTNRGKGKGFPNRGGRRPFQRGGGRFRGGSQPR